MRRFEEPGWSNSRWHGISAKKDRALVAVIIFLMSVQIVMSAIWFISNIGVVPTFGDTAEYISISETLKTDEYRTILYPLLLRCVIYIGGVFGFSYTYILYPVQFLCGVFSCFLFLYTMLYPVLCKHMTKRQFLFGCIFFSLYLNGIPIILFLHCSVLTDSLAFSFLMFTITAFANSMISVKIRWIVLLFISYMGQILLRADRIYNMSIMLIVAFLLCMPRLRKNKVMLIKTFVSCSLSVMLAIVCSVGINHATQIQGLNNRVKTTFGFVLLDRIAWPYMEENYPYFSDEIKSILSLEDAKTFDAHNNNVMYVTAPLIIESAGGVNAAEDVYIEIATTVMKHDYASVILRIFRDFFDFSVTPVSTIESYMESLFTQDKSNYSSHTNFEWNLTCASTKQPAYSKILYLYSAILGAFFFCIFCIRFFRDKWRPGSRERYFMLPLFLSQTFIAMWFAFGDGAPANNRYELIGYVFWSVLCILSMVIPCMERRSADADSGDSELSAIHSL